MNIKKFFSAAMLLASLTITGCGQGQGGGGGGTPGLQEFPEECPALIDTTSWTAGKSAANSYGANYTQLSGGGKVGVKIAIGDYDPESEGSIGSDGKLPTTSGATVVWNVKAPVAGVYQMIMRGKVSSSGDDYSFDGRHIYVTVNGDQEESNNYGERMYDDAGLDHDEIRPFIVALVKLTGNEDAISLENPYYRVVFDTESDVVFAQM